MQYRQGIRKSLKSQFKNRFQALDELLETLPASVPHAKLSSWQRTPGSGTSGAHLKGGTNNKTLSISIGYEVSNELSFILKTELRKGQAFGVYERVFVNCIVDEIGKVVGAMARESSERLLVGSRDVVDSAVASFLKQTSGIEGPDFGGVIRFLKELAQQSYENKPVTYGILISPRRATKETISEFPRDILGQKRFFALTDGFKTAMVIDRTGKVSKIASLTPEGEVGEHFRPVWLDPLADSARIGKAVGIALTRTGAILIAWKGNLLLSYRLGKWVLWYHSENVEIIREGLTHQGRKPEQIGRLAAKLYRCALDLSFRKTGGLLVTLRSPRYLSKLVPKPEQLRGKRRTKGDRAIGEWLESKSIVGIDREILCDLAALDGAIVCDRGGSVLSFGAVLSLPRKTGLGKIEGSRSRAAHSASFFGLSIKISSDGSIDVVKSGKKLLSI